MFSFMQKIKSCTIKTYQGLEMQLRHPALNQSSEVMQDCYHEAAETASLRWKIYPPIFGGKHLIGKTVTNMSI